MTRCRRKIGFVLLDISREVPVKAKEIRAVRFNLAMTFALTFAFHSFTCLISFDNMFNEIFHLQEIVWIILLQAAASTCVYNKQYKYAVYSIRV
jgi:hypothetical protein